MLQAGWLNVERARAWCRVLAVMTVLAVVGYLATSHGGVDVSGSPIGTDFVSFWTASHFALMAHPALAYQPEPHMAAERALFPLARPAYAAFFYPPTFLLLCLPLALMPYFVALGVWSVAGFAAIYGCLRRLLPQRWAILPIFAFPAMINNLGHGQNGFVTAACFGGGVIFARRRPLLAGVCLGLLVIKPHLLLAAPLALLVARRWWVIVGGIISGVATGVGSWLVLGSAAWQGFFQLSPLARATLEQGLVEPWKMQSVFAGIRLLHGGAGMAYGLQAVVAIAVLAVLAWCVARRPDAQAEMVLLVVSTLLVTPFLLDYDFVCLALPIAWVASAAQVAGWWRWEKIVLLAGYIMPLVARPLAMVSGVSVAPFVVAAVFMVVARRCAAAPVRCAS